MKQLKKMDEFFPKTSGDAVNDVDEVRIISEELLVSMTGYLDQVLRELFALLKKDVFKRFIETVQFQQWYNTQRARSRSVSE